MANLTITVSRHYLDWPLHQTIQQADLVRQLGIRVTASNGEDLTNKLVVNLTQVDIDRPGEYPVMLSAMDANGQTAQQSITLHVRPEQQVGSRQQTTAPAQPARGKKRHWILAVLAIIILLLVWWGVSAHHRAQQQEQAANNAQQSSQISDNSSSIAKLSSDNQKLANQVAQLKGAAKQYQKDHDQQALNERLDQIQSQNQQLLNQSQSSTAKEHLNEVTNVVNQVRQDPDNGVSVVNDLKNQPGFNEIWTNVSQRLSTWLSRFGN